MGKLFKTSSKLSIFLTVVLTLALAYWVWLTWDRITFLVGNSWTVWLVLTGILLFALIGKFFTFKKIFGAFGI